ncbi:MAG: amidophosphoribosyltransferase [Bacteroidetes bacterium]|nr:amidophosphoribosyltransferase [Bacteroidota bacterium]
MSDSIKHECGIVLIRLLKPLQYYCDKYGTPLYAHNKLYLLMQKQHNRGQDGAGVASIKFDLPPGMQYVDRFRSNTSSAISEIFSSINEKFEEAKENNASDFTNAAWLKTNVPFSGELFLGHLRYGTYGGNSIESCHPFLRQNNWRTRNLVVAGNFNLTNVDELFQQLIDLGQHPREKADTITVMEKIGHFLDEENDRLYNEFKDKGYSQEKISSLIADTINVETILKNASKKWDGGYAMVGLIGHGDAFVFRDPNGIRPTFYYQDEEVVVVASERPAIQTVFNVPIGSVKELTPGCALIIKKNGDTAEKQIISQKEKKSCSFERIYFSRGNDKDIYTERKKLGYNLTDKVLRAVDGDIKNTVFSYIPNTAEVAFLGLVEGVQNHLDKQNAEKIAALSINNTLSGIQELLSIKPRVEKIAIKDVKLRTFITQDNKRDDMVAHVYDTTYGLVRNHIDNLVVLDDSIVRGTTLKQSIIRILDRLHPKKIVIVSSAPQIRYPDCYGIDMARLGDFIAFQAVITLVKKSGKENFLQEVYAFAKQQQHLPKEEIINPIQKIYDLFSYEEVGKQIAELLKPVDLKAELEICYQTVDGLHAACPNHTGDWYFTGNYPTPGGNRVANLSFIYYMEGNKARAY